MSGIRTFCCVQNPGTACARLWVPRWHRVDATSRELLSGSFVIAVLSVGRVNTHHPRAAATVATDGTAEFLGESAPESLDSDGQSSMDCTDYPCDSRYRFSPDLATLVCAGCTNCVLQNPGPCEWHGCRPRAPVRPTGRAAHG